MEEELQKRNTDCVYFLASPLTCKKGIECEYRHNDIARLNPRDCWYWLAGSCLNPTCGFRHPPLESFAGKSHKSTSTSHQSVVPVNKSNGPFFYYYSGHCNKGEKCVFLHGPDDGTPTWQSTKIASGVANVQPPEKKASVGSETASAQMETHPISTKMSTEVNLHQTTNNITEENTSPSISGSPLEEGLNSPHPAEGFTEGGSHLGTAWSSDEDEIEDDVEREEEWLESSPGFDVLVNDRSEELGYEEDNDYSLQNDMDGKDLLDKQYMGYDFDDNTEYNLHLDNTGTVFEEGLLHDNELTGDIFREINGRASARQRVMDCTLPHKRKSRPRERAFRGRDNMDLRNYLKNSQTVDADTLNYINAPTRNRPRLHETTQMHSRLALKVETNATRSHPPWGSFPKGINHQNTLRHSRMSRQHFKRRHDKKLHFQSKVSGRGVHRKRESTTDDSNKVFSGPKTLSQIKEEKRRTKGDGSVEDDFQGPKSLAEILKDKRK